MDELKKLGSIKKSKSLCKNITQKVTSFHKNEISQKNFKWAKIRGEEGYSG